MIENQFRKSGKYIFNFEETVKISILMDYYFKNIVDK